jgi:hypothetical protein
MGFVRPRFPKTAVQGLKTAPEVWDSKNCRKITRKLANWETLLSQWNRWVATYIHLDQLAEKQQLDETLSGDLVATTDDTGNLGRTVFKSSRHA